MNSQQRLELVEIAPEQIERGLHWLWCREIHPGVAQQRDAVIGGARGQEAQIAVPRRLALCEYLAGERRRGGDTRRVLVNVVRRVEVRDAHPLVLDQLVYGDLWPVVLVVQPLEDLAEQLRRERLAALGARMG